MGKNDSKGKPLATSRPSKPIVCTKSLRKPEKTAKPFLGRIINAEKGKESGQNGKKK